MRQALLVLCSVLLLATVNASDQFEDNRSIDFSAEYSPDPPFTGPLQASGPASLGNNRPGYNQLAGPGLPPNYMSPLDQRVGFRERMQAPSVVGSGSDMMAEFQQKLLNNPLAVLLPAHGSRQPSPTLEELSATPPQRHAPVDVPDLAPQPSQQPQPQQQQQQQQQSQQQQPQQQQQQQQEQQQQLQQQQLQLQQQQQQLQQLMQQQQEQQHQLEQQQQRQPISVVEAAAPAPQGEGPVPTPGPVAPASSVSGFPPSLTFTPVPELRAPLSAPPSPAPQVSDAVAGEGQSVQGPSASAPAPAPAQSVNTEPSTLTPSAEAKSQPQSAASATPLPVVEAVHDVKRLMSESARRHHHLHRKPRKTSAYEDRPPRASSDTLDSPSDSDSSAAASPSSPAEAPVSRPEGEHPAASLPENKSIQVLETALENEMKNVAVLQSALNALKGKLEPVQKDHP